MYIDSIPLCFALSPRTQPPARAGEGLARRAPPALQERVEALSASVLRGDPHEERARGEVARAERAMRLEVG